MRAGTIVSILITPEISPPEIRLGAMQSNSRTPKFSVKSRSIAARIEIDSTTTGGITELKMGKELRNDESSPQFESLDHSLGVFNAGNIKADETVVSVDDNSKWLLLPAGPIQLLQRQWFEPLHATCVLCDADSNE